MRVLIVGDIHERHRLLAEVLRQTQVDYRIEAAIQVGDFGFRQELLDPAGRTAVRYPVPLYAIDGNHEDHRWLRRALRAGAEKTWQQAANLIYQPRSSVALLGASRVGFIGGALHVDRPQRHNLASRSPNYILRREREHATALFNRERPELIVTHSCPARIGIGLASAANHAQHIAEHIAAAGFDPGPEDDCGEAELTRLWFDLNYRPRAWVFGHFHRPHQTSIEGTHFVCVSDDLETPERPLVIWDTEEKRIFHCPADPSAGPAG